MISANISNLSVYTWLTISFGKVMMIYVHVSVFIVKAQFELQKTKHALVYHPNG